MDAESVRPIAGHQLDSAPKAWRDIIVDGKRLDVDYYNE